MRRRGFQANETSGGKTPENPFMDPVCQCGMHSDRRNIGHCAETKTEVLPLAGHSIPEIRSAEMKALLIKTDGEQVMLGKESRQLKEKNGMLIAIDSGGLEYPLQKQFVSHTTDYNELIVPRAGMYCLSLSDGTRAWLNADSRLKYPVVFAENERRIRLSGEGYFKVAKDTQAPFIVETDLGEIRVMGTEFNVKCYPDETIIATTLVNGKVSFINSEVPEGYSPPVNNFFSKEGTRKLKSARSMSVIISVGKTIN